VRLLHETLLRAAAAHPDKVAVVDHDARLRYAELLERAARLARGLQERGVTRGDRVAVYLDNGVGAAVAIYGALLAGAAFMVVNPQTKGDKLRYILSDAGAAALVSHERFGATLRKVAPALPDLHTVVLEGAGEGAGPDAGGDGAAPARDGGPRALPMAAMLAAYPPQPLDQGGIPLDLAALIYTSGSTGNPKGVMLSHQNMVFTLGSLVQYLRLSQGDRIFNVLPLAFDYGLYQLLMAVHLGATVVLENSFAFPARIVARAAEEEVTVLPGVPTVFATLLALHRNKPVSLPSVTRITNTAAHLPDGYVPALKEMCPEALIFKMYGLTECKRVAYLEPELVEAKPSSVGRPIPGTEAFVLDDDGRPVPAGVSGVLHVRGPHVMMGYWNLPEETARMLVPGPYPGERMLDTHDRFRIDEEGYLYFVGRSDDIIKSRGEKVSPVEVENVLHAIPGVKEAAVIGVPDERLGEAVAAYVVLHDGSDMTEGAFRRHCMARLESFMVPRDIIFVTDLPRTGTGKVRKRDLSHESRG